MAPVLVHFVNFAAGLSTFLNAKHAKLFAEYTKVFLFFANFAINLANFAVNEFINIKNKDN